MKKLLFVLTVLVLMPVMASGATLKVGAASGITSLDPHFHDETPTNSANHNIFDGLVNLDKDLNPYPTLAVSWKVLNDTTWEFKLRKGVKFHNGNPFTADDVVWSFDRIQNSKKSGFKAIASSIKTMEKVDDYTVNVITKKPFPILLQKLSYIRIMDKEYSSTLSDEELALKPVGTGPYKLVKWVRGQSLTLEANNEYFLGKPAIDKIVLKPLTNDATRVAAMLSKAVDLINQVPIRDVNRIKKQAGLQFYMRPGLRLIYLQLDQGRDKSPYVTGVDKNPFKDVRVRKAFYYGINETSIVKHIMGGFAKESGQFYPEAVNGHIPDLGRPKYDPEKATALLKEAGYENGFTVVLDSPNDRYVNDEKIAQAIASSLAKIGITVKVNAIPKASFFPKANDADSSFNLIGYASNDGDGSSFLEANVHTFDQSKGFGRFNGGRYSNPKVDTLIEQAAGVLDPAKRLSILQEAMQIALVEDMNIIPLHYQVDIYTYAKKVDFEPRADTFLYFKDMKLK